MKLILASCCLAMLPLCAQQHGLIGEGEKKKNPLIGDPQAIAAGNKQFANGCAACHGNDAKGGRGPNLMERLRAEELDDDALHQVIQKGLPGMPGANLSEDQTWQLIAFLRSMTSPAAAGHVPGNAAAGEELFGASGGCANCHAIRGKGGRLGPDLTNIGGERTVTQLRDAILQPNANPVPGYLSATVTMNDGRTLRGVARNRTNYSVQFQDRDGNLHLLQMDQVRELTISKQSPMPDDFVKRLSQEQIQNLLAYLSLQSVRPVEVSKK